MATRSASNMLAEYDFDIYDFRDEEDGCIGSIYESIETNLWLADAYVHRGAEGLAAECLRAGWFEYERFAEVIDAYAGSDRLREKLLDRSARLGLAVDVPALALAMAA